MVKIGILEIVLKLKDEFSKQMKSVKDSGTRTTSTLTKLWQNFGISTGQVFNAIYNAAKRFFTFINREFIKQERALARLRAQLKNYGNLSKENIDIIKEQATELQNLTGIDDDAVISSAALAQSYGLTFNQIQKLLPAMVDMAAFTEKTTGKMGAMEDQVKLMGYVMEGQTGRLKLMGITMTDTEKRSIALGDKSQRLATFLDVVKNNAGGVAESMHNAAGGGFEDLKNAFSDVGQAIGEEFVPSLDKAAGSFASFLQNTLAPAKEISTLLNELDIHNMQDLYDKLQKIGEFKMDLDLTDPEILIDLLKKIKTESDKTRASMQELPKFGLSYGKLKKEISLVKKELEQLNEKKSDGDELSELELNRISELTINLGYYQDQLQTVYADLYDIDQANKDLFFSYDALTDAITQNTKDLQPYLLLQSQGIILSEEESIKYNALVEDKIKYSNILENMTAKTKALTSTQTEQLSIVQQISEAYGTAGQAALASSEGFILAEEKAKALRNAGLDDAEVAEELLRLEKSGHKVIYSNAKEQLDLKDKSIAKSETEKKQIIEKTELLQKQSDTIQQIVDRLKLANTEIDNYNKKELVDKSATITIYRKTVRV